MTRRHAVPLKKMPLTWILVADGKQAQIYARETREKRIPVGSGSAKHRHYNESLVQELFPVPDIAWQAESPEIYEAGRDRLGRVFESGNSAHHMSEPRIGIHEEIKQHFMKLIANQLNHAKVEKAFDRLVLVAPAKMLGELREYLDRNVLKSVVAELPKDLTHCEGGALAEHLENII